jgi:glycosyltransferase involved in cell wall biosynthesis
MPVYNASEFLNMSINSLIKQSFNDLELICVDDGSTDNSLEILNKFSSKYNFIKVIRQKNMGSGKARNNGIDNASGDYIAFLDADDIFVDKNALEIMYKTAVNNNADMVCGNLKRLTKDKKIIEDIHKNEAYSFFDDYGFISPKEYGVPWAFYKNIFKRNFLNQYNIRFPDLKRGQDPVFLANVLVHMINIPVTPVTLYGYNFSVGGGTDNKINSYDKKKDYITHFKETFNILNNHGFEVVSEKYKKYLFNFLNNPNNYNDLDLYDIVIDVFGNDESFKNYNDEFVFFKITHLLNLLKVSDSNDFFKKVKSEFLIMDIESNCIIENNLKEEFNIVCESNNINTCKLNLLQFEINNLKSENQKLNNNYKKLKNDNYYLRKLNNELLNSSSWKITKPLRTFKRIFRK